MRLAALNVVRRLQEAGHTAYWVGGCVRDLLRGATPVDYDVATSATPEVSMALFDETRAVGKSFGVVLVRLDDAWVEVATFRSEGAYTEARRPSRVHYVDAEQDARRRDFTINALFLDPLRGSVIDYVGGRQDLAARRLRCVGDAEARFHEDALRLLRAVRFACAVDLQIEPATRAAIRRNAPRVQLLAAERVRDELLAMLSGAQPRRALELLDDLGLVQELLPELLPLKGCTQSPLHHPEGDVWVHTLGLLQQAAHVEPALALGALLHDVGKPATRSDDNGEVHFYGHEKIGQQIAARIMKRLKISTRMQERVQMLIGQHMRFLNVPEMRRSTLRRFVLQDGFAHLLELHRIDAMASSGNLIGYELCREELETLAEAPEPMRPLLSGHDLLALGYMPGPGLGVVLRALVDAQLEGEVTDADGAQRWMLRHHPPPRSDEES